MTPERWGRVLDVFHEVLAHPPAARAAVLADACGDDKALRAEVERLIVADAEAGSFGDRPLAGFESRVHGATAVATMAASPQPGAMTDRCSRCGCPLVGDPNLPNLCPLCLLRLALGDRQAAREPLTPGRVVGERYRVLRVLGRGGMGEVVQAFDLKLRVDVALKALYGDRAGTERARELIRAEVRAAREVVSPNVCRIFDLIVADGEELVSMEFIDGLTLNDALRERGPLSLHETQTIASQFLSGLDAIHRAGLVHRDLKPENIMITRAGRVVIMDFGLANGASTDVVVRGGTPGYIAPEAHLGQSVDARVDVYAAGVVLAEMLTVGGNASTTTRRAVWQSIRQDPLLLPDAPWSPVLRKAVAANPDARYSSAHELARALEEITQRLPGFEQRQPYPGLAAFTPADAEYFFGREVETEQIWKKLERPRLLGLVGPSGAGKTSFLHAGLLPLLPETWKGVVATPGDRPFNALAQALAPILARDPEALQALFRLDDGDSSVSLADKLRQRQDHLLLVIDQFEELFTLSPPAVQAAFARLLGHLVLDANIRVIVSIRDDFLLRCQDHEALRPMFTDLTPLGALSRSALRRALVQPALKCGYHFEDDGLVDEMVSEVSGERGALPLLAFAASRVWERRDRERGLLTREAYRETGGVAGALARHAEAALERIGRQRTPIVRELFRNLVTSEGTRAVREREDLLSVFGPPSASTARSDAAAVLDALIDARLLTSYERFREDGTTDRLVEIIHESLLAAWPQLVQWRVQDAEGAQIRDQLRHAARVWQERGRPDDLLWSGTAYRDFTVWRERYLGALSAGEEAFANAAAARVQRGQRRRRWAAASLVTAVVVVALVTFGLWRQSEGRRVQAVAEAQRAEGGRLLAMSEREVDRYPTAALAYAIKGLELADNDAGRQLALRIIQRHPVARVARIQSPGRPLTDARGRVMFSPTSDWFAWAGSGSVGFLRRAGGMSRLVEGVFPSSFGRPVDLAFDPSGSLVVTGSGGVRILSPPDGREIARAESVDPADLLVHMDREGFITLTRRSRELVVRQWPLPMGRPRLVGTMPAPVVYAANARALAYAADDTLHVRTFDAWNAQRAIARLPRPVRSLALSPDSSVVATSDHSDEIRLWPTTNPGGSSPRVLRSPGTVVGLNYDPDGRWIVAATFENGHPRLALFDLRAPQDAEPRVIQKGDTAILGGIAFDTTGQWLATAHGPDIAFWPLNEAGPVVRTAGAVPNIHFSVDGEHIVTLSLDGRIRSWPLRGGETKTEAVDSSALLWRSMARDDTGERLAVTGGAGLAQVIRLDDGSVRRLDGFSANVILTAPVFTADGRTVAAGVREGPPAERVIRVWDIATGTSRAFGPWRMSDQDPPGPIGAVAFAGRDRLIASVLDVGIISIELISGMSRVLTRQPTREIAVDADSHNGVGVTSTRDSFLGSEEPRSLFRFDLVTGEVWPLGTHGTRVTAVALHPSAPMVATGSFDGVIRVGPISGGEPHLILGQEGEGAIYSISFSPDGRWLAASGEGFAVHVWPLSDLHSRPLERRPYTEFLSMLRSYTNLEAVADPTSRSGYRLEPAAFPGWASPPAH